MWTLLRSHSSAASHRLSAVALVTMYNSAGCSPAAKTEQFSQIFHLNSFGIGGHSTARAQGEDLPNQKLRCYVANFLPLEKKWAEEGIEGQSSISKRETKIMIALTCSRGAVCSLKSSREEVIQWWAACVFCHHARRGATHKTNMKRNSRSLRHACSQPCSLICVVIYMEKCTWDSCLCQFYFQMHCHYFRILHGLFLLGFHFYCVSISFFFIYIYLPLWHFYLDKSVMLFSVTDCHNKADSTWKEFLKALLLVFLNTWCPV